MPQKPPSSPAQAKDKDSILLSQRLTAANAAAQMSDDHGTREREAMDALVQDMLLADQETIAGCARHYLNLTTTTTADLLDRLQYLQVFGAHLAMKATGQSEAPEAFHRVLQEIINDPLTPVFVRLGAQYAEQCIHLQGQDTSGKWRRSGISAERRLPEGGGADEFFNSYDLLHHVTPPPSLSRDDRLVQIANDAIGHLNENDQLIAVAAASRGNLRKRSTIVPGILRAGAEHLGEVSGDPESFGTHVSSLIGPSNDLSLLDHYLSEDAVAWRNFRLHRERYLTTIDRYVRDRATQRTLRQQELSTINQAYSQQLGVFMQQPDAPQVVADEAVQEDQDGRTKTESALPHEVHTRRDRYRNLLNAEDHASHAAITLRREHLEAERRLAAAEHDERHLLEEYAAFQRSWEELHSRPGFTQRLRAALLAIAKQEESTLFQAQWRSVEDLTHDPAILPFKVDADEKLNLLLRHLHRPAIRRALEAQLDVSLQSLPFISQLHMARFLAEADQLTFDRLKHSLHRAEADAPAILHSFFACSESPSMGHTILSIANEPEAMPALHAYAELAAGADETAGTIAALLRDANGPPQLTKEYFYRQLIVRANRLLRQLADRLQNAAESQAGTLAAACAERLLHENDQIQQTRTLVECLPRNEVSRLNLSQLRTVELKEAFPATSLKDEEMRDRMTAVVRRQFPSGDDSEFREDFLENRQARLVYSTCAGKLLAFFGMTPMDERGERVYLDWFFADPDSPVQYLAEATLISTLKKYEDRSDYEHVAKPHVRSMSIMLEQMPGCVGFGSTRDGEYKHHYLRFRTTRAERGAYRSKSLREAELKRLWQLCETTDTIQTDEKTGLACCRIVFHGRDHHDDISAADDEGFIFRAVQEMCERGNMVMTRAIPAPNNYRGRQEYLCVFERDATKDPPQAA